MLRIIGILLALSTLLASHDARAARNFLYTSSGELASKKAILSRPDIEGVQVVYNWKRLEKERGDYDFSAIEEDLAVAAAFGKKLFIQVQDRFFDENARNVPDYLLTDPAYGGGLARQFDNAGEGKPVGTGWVAMQWNAAVRGRYQRLLAALARQFDGRIYGINLPETAIDMAADSPNAGFSCDAYFAAEMENLAFARRVFSRSRVVQYVNFWPCEWNDDRQYMSRIFAYAAANDVGLGGPDIVPGRKAQMDNSYRFFHRFKGRLPLVAMAIQEPTLTYTNPATGKPFTKREFERFADDFLGVDIIFWSAESPWLK
jgi:hypothetical protein